MYMELTPQDTIKDLQRLLIDAIPAFEFPRKPLYNYKIETKVILESEVTEDDFIIGMVWEEMIEENQNDLPSRVLVEKSSFEEELTAEEAEILAILMMINWLQRQITSIENTRMKYSGTDFKMTSQANHLSKLQSLLGECQRQSHHMQRLYKRRRLENGVYRSNWDVFNTNNF